ncbi:MAG: rod shape-determining protein MreC [Solirubrobacterales bacterium]|nr:rod shape-determining protein MreC [Solirubrobacterales bacterium]
MYDPKTIRRRRAVLALLVVSSVVLLTASFGGGGGVSSVQRGVFELVSPIQDVASRSLKPFRDLFGWFGDTWRSKGENDALRKDRDALRQQNVKLQAQLRNAGTAARLLQLDQAAGLSAMGPVTARVTSVTPTLLFQSFVINKGSANGIKVGQAVVTSGGLVGRISVVTSGHATVKLLTDSAFGVQARVARTGTPGIVISSGGSPEDLIMRTTKLKAPVADGATITTRGTAPAAKFPSLFPPDIAIGIVTRVDDAGTDSQTVHLKPFVDVRSVDQVQVLTRDPASIP